jgi:hypothetical protein
MTIVDSRINLYCWNIIKVSISTFTEMWLMVLNLGFREIKLPAMYYRTQLGNNANHNITPSLRNSLYLYWGTTRRNK